MGPGNVATCNRAPGLGASLADRSAHELDLGDFRLPFALATRARDPREHAHEIAGVVVGTAVDAQRDGLGSRGRVGHHRAGLRNCTRRLELRLMRFRLGRVNLEDCVVAKGTET